MVTVYLPIQIANLYTNGAHKLEASGKKIDQIMNALDKQYPGIKKALSDSFAIALDSQIIHDWFDEELGKTSTIRFIQAIEGG